MCAALASCALPQPHARRRPARLPDAVRRLMRVGSVISGMWTAALTSMASFSPARALELGGSEGDRIDETIAFRERLQTYDGVKKYGGERVSDRDRKLFSPDGVRAGSFLVLPSIGTTVVFDDNVYLSNQNRKADIRTELTPELRIISQWPRHAFDLSLGGKIVGYMDRPDLDHADGFAKARAALHFDHAHTLSVGISTRLDHEDRLDPFTPVGGQSLVEVMRNKASIGLTRDAGRLYGTVSLTGESAAYKDTGPAGGGVDQSARDMQTLTGEVKVGYRFSPGFELVGKLRGLRQWNRGDGTTSFDGTGYEVLAGLQMETSPLLRWHLLGGYGGRDYDQAGLASQKSWLAEAQVQWLPLPLLTVYGTARRSFSDTAGFGVGGALTGGIVETSGKIRLEYEAWHNIVLNAQAEYKDLDYADGRHDRVAAARIGVDWYASHNWLFNISYEHLVRDSNQAVNDLTRNMVSVSAKLRF